MRKLSPKQFFWLATLGRDPRGNAFVILKDNGTYNPFASDQKTFDALEERGLIEWYPGANHGSYNGYRITEAGREFLWLSEDIV